MGDGFISSVAHSETASGFLLDVNLVFLTCQCTLSIRHSLICTPVHLNGIIFYSLGGNRVQVALISYSPDAELVVAAVARISSSTIWATVMSWKAVGNSLS